MKNSKFRLLFWQFYRIRRQRLIQNTKTFTKENTEIKFDFRRYDAVMEWNLNSVNNGMWRPPGRMGTLKIL
jgi:hypothetical protein